MNKSIVCWAAMGMICALGAATAAARSADKIDRDLAAHPDVGRLYVRAFNAGVRVPQAFRGEWSSHSKTCGTEGDDLDTRLTVGPVTVHFYDETHVVTAVKALGSRSVALSYGGPVKDYHYMIAPPVLSLSKDGKTLMGSDETGKEKRGRWSRCPKGSNLARQD